MRHDLLNLPANEAHLYYVRFGTHLEPGAVDACTRRLSAAEQMRLAEKHSQGRLAYLLTRVLVRRTLSRYADVAPEAWELSANAYGKPEITSPQSALRFNVAHTTELTTCLIARDLEVGVDVEHRGRGARLEVAQRFFAPSEVTDLMSRDEPEQTQRFLAYWTLKEAYLKGRGLGLRLPLEAFAFDLEAQPINVRFFPPIEDSGRDWQFSLHQLTPQHLAAVALYRAPASTIVRIKAVTIDELVSD